MSSKIRSAQSDSFLGDTRIPPQPDQNDVHSVCNALVAEYGLPRHDNPIDPLDDLIYVLVSTRSRISDAARVYKVLKEVYPEWALVLDRPDDLLTILRPMGLSVVKAAQILGIVARLWVDFHEVSLSPTADYTEAQIEKYLSTLPGVSLKIAKCVMMYTLGFQVLPVDSNVYRIAKRLGWVTTKRADLAHEELERLVPPPLRYGFHVDAISHGNQICRPKKPLCDQCIISNNCWYFRTVRNR